MANIKVSEMTEATVFDDDDYAMIVQANQNKKITKINMMAEVESEITDIEDEINSITDDIGDIENEISDINGTVLFEYTNQNPTTLNDTIANYKIIEIYSKKIDQDANVDEFFPIQKFYTNNQENVTLLLNATYNVNGGVYSGGQQITINGTNITLGYYYRVIIVGGQTPYASTATSNVRVLKIVGYK